MISMRSSGGREIEDMLKFGSGEGRRSAAKSGKSAKREEVAR